MKVLSLVFAAVISTSCQADEVTPTTQKCIGFASIDAQSNIKLNLISTEPTHGGAMLLIDKSDPLYAEVRKHVGRLRVGEWKCVKPWADETSLARTIDSTEKVRPRPLPKQ